MLAFQILILIIAVNFAPPVLAYYFEGRWETPVDFGRKFVDGRPIFGSHKTYRGLAAAILVGIGVGWLLGFSPAVGAAVALLSMAGDLLTSFLKRRAGLVSGKDIPASDHLLECVFPLAFVAGKQFISPMAAIGVGAFFLVGGYAGTYIWKQVVLRCSPPEGYPRPLRKRVIFRELASCRLRSRWMGRFLNFEDAIYYHLFIHTFFKCIGLYNRGVANALAFERKNLEIELKDLPAGFDGFTILLMTDLHLDGLTGLTERLGTVLESIEADICILGGDYRMATHGAYEDALYRMKKLIPSIRSRNGILAILGNHDCIDMSEGLKRSGVQVLINDAQPVHSNGQSLWFVGVDDPHYYRTHDIDLAFQDVPEDAFAIFLSHSPSLYNKLESYKPALYLAGHTHAGQVQIPPVGPVFTHCFAPRKYCQGLWSYNGMKGYTSAGVGVSGVPVRFNCRGEVTVITLRRPR